MMGAQRMLLCKPEKAANKGHASCAVSIPADECGNSRPLGDCKRDVGDSSCTQRDTSGQTRTPLEKPWHQLKSAQ